MGTLCAQLLLQFYADSFETLNRSIGHGLKTCMWFGYNPQIRFCHFFRNLNLVFFSGINTINICRQYYLVINTPINFTFSDDSVFLKKKSWRGHKFSEFACFYCFQVMPEGEGQEPSIARARYTIVVL